MIKMAENGRKWQKIDFRGYLVGNGFPRVLRHSPTTRVFYAIPLLLTNCMHSVAKPWNHSCYITNTNHYALQQTIKEFTAHSNSSFKY